MLVQLLQLIPERFLTFSQHAQEGICVVEAKLRKHMWRCWYLYQISRKTRLQLFSWYTRRWGCYRQCTVRKEMKSTTIEKKTKIDILETFFLLSTTISSSTICSKSSTPQISLLKKLIYLAYHCPEKNSNDYTESILWLYVFCDRIISNAKLVHICWIAYLFVSAPNLPHSSVYFRVKQPKLVNK